MNSGTLARPKVPLAKAPLAKTLLPKSTPHAAFGRTVRNEARLAWRQPAGLIFGTGVPLLLLIIFGELPSFHQPQASLGGLALFQVYVPIILTFVIAILRLIGLPAPNAPARCCWPSCSPRSRCSLSA